MSTRLQSPRPFSLLALSALTGCGAPAEAPPPSRPAVPAAPRMPTWCESVNDALGDALIEAGFRCLDIPNFLVSGFYGTRDNPERSDFANACFAGAADPASVLQLSVRPVGDLRFSYEAAQRVSAAGGLDLEFLGPWAPSMKLDAMHTSDVRVQVELHDAEIRVLSSVAEILGHVYRDAVQDGEVSAALEACLDTLCDGNSDEALVYTAKVLAAVPVIRVDAGDRQQTGARVAVAADTLGFEVREEEAGSAALELRAKDKLNVAAVLEPARPAFERAKTCQSLTDARVRRAVVTGLRELGLRALAGRNADGIEQRVVQLRTTVVDNTASFTEDEQKDLLGSLAALEAASREIARDKPDRAVCTTRDLVQTVLSGNGDENRLHDLLTDVAQPLHRRLTDIANDHSLPCADPAYYRDRDGDGYGDPRTVVRAAKPPAGHVENSLDCFDRDAEARPGQRKFFTSPRSDGSFDYDCDGKQSPESTVVAGGCKSITRFGIPIRCWAEPGWRNRAAPCGEQGRWFSECDEGLLSCDEGPESFRRQGCR